MLFIYLKGKSKKMGKKILALLFIISLFRLHGQNAEPLNQTRSLFNGITISHWGFFAGSGLQVSTINNQSVWLQNIGIGAAVNHKFRFGASFSYALNDKSVLVNQQKWSYDLLMGGLELEYVFSPHKVFHFTMPLQIGAVYNEYNDNEDYALWPEDYDEYLFGYLQPGLQLEINVLPYLRLNGGAFYRFVYGSAEAPLSPQQLSGPVANLGFKIGLF